MKELTDDNCLGVFRKEKVDFGEKKKAEICQTNHT